VSDDTPLLEIQTPPDGTLLSSMLYEGLLRIKNKCMTQLTKECLKSGLLEILGDKNIDFRFTGNDVRYVKFKRLDSDFIEFLFKNIETLDLRIRVELVREKGKMKVKVSSPSSSRAQKEYSFQIMKVDRYKGISSIELQTIDEEITTYADMNGLLMFFYGLASSYVTTVRTEDNIDYYFLFFDIETLLRDVLGGNPTGWLDIKDHVVLAIRDVIRRFGEFNDEAITLAVLLNTYVLESLKKLNVQNISFRLVKVRGEDRTYKVYVDMPIGVYIKHKLYEDIELVNELSGVLSVLLEPAGRFVRGRDEYGDGYHAFKSIRYLYNYIASGSPVYLFNMYREVLEAYNSANRNKASYAEEYLRCFLRSHIKR
jgi:hypothetical protein